MPCRKVSDKRKGAAVRNIRPGWLPQTADSWLLHGSKLTTERLGTEVLRYGKTIAESLRPENWSKCVQLLTVHDLTETLSISIYTISKEYRYNHICPHITRSYVQRIRERNRLLHITVTDVWTSTCWKCAYDGGTCYQSSKCDSFISGSWIVSSGTSTSVPVQSQHGWATKFIWLWRRYFSKQRGRLSSNLSSMCRSVTMHYTYKGELVFDQMSSSYGECFRVSQP